MYQLQHLQRPCQEVDDLLCKADFEASWSSRGRPKAEGQVQFLVRKSSRDWLCRGRLILLAAGISVRSEDTLLGRLWADTC